MKWEELTSSEYEIKDVHYTIRDSELQLSWYWPKTIDFVYVLILSAGKIDTFSPDQGHRMKLYTREEYKAKQGFYERVESIGKFGVRIFPCVKEGEDLICLRQEKDNNLVYFTTGRARVYYSILYKKNLFQSRKKVKMTIMSEIPIEREVLCYVKKEGAVPVSIEDGTFYPFVQDFEAGETALPEIQLDKNEFIRIFFKNKKDAETYELIPK